MMADIDEAEGKNLAQTSSLNNGVGQNSMLFSWFSRVGP